MLSTSYRLHLLTTLVIGALLSHVTHAGEVPVLTEFKDSTPAKAAEVNGNFTAIKDVVNENNTRLDTLASDTATNKSGITDLKTRVEKIETQCPPDMVVIGPSCIDKYENSVWETILPDVIVKIKNGTALNTNLNTVTQRGHTQDDYDSARCPDNADDCSNVYAASVAGVKPSRFITWFQAAAACANSGKRLPTNQEWQIAALGTPDPGVNTANDNTCNVSTGVGSANGVYDPTGTRTLCISKRGAYDMVGNVWEWTADWMQGAGGTNAASQWLPTPAIATSVNTPTYGEDVVLQVNAAVNQPATSKNFPAAIIRGGDSAWGTGAGVFAFDAFNSPSNFTINIGFRCAK